MVVSRMSSAPSAQCEELQQLLEKREAELDAFKEERRDKDAAINFLKNKIVSLQNQSRVTNYVVQRQTSSDTQMLESLDDLSPTMGLHTAVGHPSAALAAAAIAERDRQIDDLQQQLAQMQQESQRSARAVNRMLSGGAAWELEETRRRLADRDREVTGLRQTLDWQECEIRRISEQSTSDLEDLRQRFVLRDREVEELKRALEDLESSRREHHLEVELRRQSEQNRRLTVQLQREELEVRNLRKQLQEAREEVAWLWKSLHESHDEQESTQEEAGKESAIAAVGLSEPSTAAAPTAIPAVGAGMDTSYVSSTARSVARKVCETFLGDDLLEALVPIESKATSPPAHLANEQFNGSSAAAGAEAAAGDLRPAAARAALLLGHSRPAVPPGGAEAAAGDERPICEAADAGAGVARRGGEDQSYPSKSVDKFGSFAYEGREAIVVTTNEGCALKHADLELPDDSIKTPDTVELELPGTPELKDMLDVPTAREEPSPPDAEEPQEVTVTGGGALFSVNFFDGNEDIAAKEAKRQRVTRQIERRRQARGATAGAAAAAAGNGHGRTPSSAGGEIVGCADESLQHSMLHGTRAPAMTNPLRLPLPTRESTGGSTAGSPRMDNVGQIATPTMSSAKGSPLLSARFEPASGSSPPPQNMQVSSLSPTNMSDTSSCALGKTPTLHSKFEGLRDEMKRRRSERTALTANLTSASQDAQELAEAVVAEANANARHSPAVASHASQAASMFGLAASPGGAMSPAATSISAASLAAQAATAVAPAAAIIATTSAPAGEAAPHTPMHGGAPSPMTGSLSSPVHSARVLKATNAIGPSPGERVIRTTAGGPERFSFARLGGSTRAPPPQVITPDTDAGHSMVPPSPTAQNASPFFIALAPQAPSGPPSPAMSFTPHAGQAGPSPPGSHRHQPQRLRSVPQEHLSSARSNMSNSSELDRCRRNTLSLSARSVTINHTDVTTAARPSRPGDIPGEMEHDPLHEAVVRFCMQRPGRYPLVRLSRGVYLYGNKKLVIAIHNDKLMVRIGGGFVHLESYLIDADRSSGAPATAANGMSGTASFDPTPRMQGAGAAKAQAARRR